MSLIDIKTDVGAVKGKIAFYCATLNVTRQGFYRYLMHRDTPWKYEGIAEKMRGIVAEDECNDTYGRCRMYQALKLKYPKEDIPGERTVCRIMEKQGWVTDRTANQMAIRKLAGLPGNRTIF